MSSPEAVHGRRSKAEEWTPIDQEEAEEIVRAIERLPVE
jgi:hypothetical protein